MRKTILVIFAVLMLALSSVNAITQQEINEAKRLIDSKTDCKNLSGSQLEIIGEYEMELMHPGESHETMHKMMGINEGSEAEKQFHISMAKRLYCGENIGMIGMMGGGMMNMMSGNNFLGNGMMGNYGYGFGYWNFFDILYAILLIGLIILVFLGIMKLWKGLFRAKGK